MEPRRARLLGAPYCELLVGRAGAPAPTAWGHRERFHHALHQIFEPLRIPAEKGLQMDCADAVV